MSNFAIYTNSLIFLANTNSVLLQRAQKPLSIYIKDSCEMWLNSMQNFLQKSPAPLPWKIWMQMGPYWMKTALTPFSLPKRWVALSIYIKDSCKTMWLNSMHFFWQNWRSSTKENMDANGSLLEDENSADTIFIANMQYFLLQTGGWLYLYPLRIPTTKHGSILWDTFCTKDWLLYHGN